MWVYRLQSAQSKLFITFCLHEFLYSLQSVQLAYHSLLCLSEYTDCKRAVSLYLTSMFEWVFRLNAACSSAISDFYLKFVWVCRPQSVQSSLSLTAVCEYAVSKLLAVILISYFYVCVSIQIAKRAVKRISYFYAFFPCVQIAKHAVKYVLLLHICVNIQTAKPHAVKLISYSYNVCVSIKACKASSH